MRVLIVDDHPTVVSRFRALLESHLGVEVFEASDSRAGYAAYFTCPPDVAVIRLDLPGLSGLDLVRRILRRKRRAKIVTFSVNDDPAVAGWAIEAGARGYIMKNDDPALFVDAVKSVAAGDVYLRAEMAREIAFLRASAKAIKISNLSARELGILRLITAGWTLAEIAEEVDLSYRTIANTCSQLKQKLGARSTGDLMRIALEAKLFTCRNGPKIRRLTCAEDSFF
jgi:two-component system, NarL family, invasion response regulator UvrY